MRYARLSMAALAVGSGLVWGTASASAALVHRYSFNDGTANDSAGTANGTLKGNATIAGGTLTTTGANTAANNVTLPAAVGTGITGDFTIEDFVTQNTANADFGTLFSFSNAQSQFLLVNAIRPGSNVLRVNLSTNNNEQALAGPGPLPAGTQSDLAITYVAASGLTTVYLNGQQVATGTVSGFNFQTVSNGAFDGINGNAPFTSDNSANASTDDFRIYNNALSASDVAASFTAGPNAVIAVPEPAGLTLLGLAGVGALARRRRQA